MQGYQRHAAPQGSHSSCALSLYPIGGMVHRHMYQSALGRGRPAVPVSPGHVRPLNPYPPSRRRRR
jgi:hypothetical protein